MKAILFANIGNRDLGQNWIDNNRGNASVYDTSKRLFEDRFFEFNAILLEPVLDYIIEHYSLEDIYLFGTEQINHNPKDTIYMAYIIKEIIKRKYNLLDKNIKIIQITRDPSDRDTMYDFYHEFFKGIHVDGIAFVSLTGGAPAQNEALLFESILKFGQNIQALYLPMDKKDVKILSVGERIYKSILDTQLDAFKKKQLYAPAIEIAEKYDLDEDLDLLKGENYKDLFDFGKALDCYNKAFLKYSGNKRNEINKKIKRIERLNERNIEALLEELYENMIRRWEQGAYVDFLGRLFRFDEAVLRFWLEKEFNISTEPSEYSKFKDFIYSKRELKEFLEKERTSIDKLNRKVMFDILRYFVKNPDQITHIEDIDATRFIYDILKKIKNLSDLRNSSILGHGFDGVSKEKIDEKYDGNILNDLNDLVEILREFRH